MKVLYLAPGRKYDVWALCNEEEVCQVLEELQRIGGQHPDLVEAIMALLLEVVPNDGPPLDDPRRAKRLYRNLLYELKVDKDISRREHVGIRVAFFFDVFYGGEVVVCTNAFPKTGSSTPEGELDTALRERARYFEERDNLEFIEVPYEQGH
jgi:hypothetical protein